MQPHHALDWYVWSYRLLELLICLFFITAAGMVSKLLKVHLLIKGKTRLQYMEWRRRSERSPLETLLAQAGRPFGLTAWRWQAVRYSVCLLLLLEGSLRGAAEGGLGPLLVRMSGVLAWLLLTNGRVSLLTFLLRKWKEVHDGEKNRELFMVYSMIADELEAGGQRLNLYAMLNKLKDYTHLIKPALNKGLRRFDEGPYAALMAAASEIGTREAKELCKLLADLETTRTEELTAMAEAREDSFNHMLRENRRRSRKLFGSIAYGAAFAPLLVYLWNTLHIAQQYVADLARTTNHLQ